MLSIQVFSTPHKAQRYETLGDWYWDRYGQLVIKVSRSGNWRSELAIAMHEILEALLCNEQRIPTQAVDEFDMRFLAEGGLGEPGDAPDCPYRDQHAKADKLERFVCELLNLPWEEHEAICDAIEAGTPQHEEE